MTEDEAKTKWCPFVSDGDPRRVFDGRWNNRCITGQCAVWEWTVSPERVARRGIPAQGYCGLARR